MSRVGPCSIGITVTVGTGGSGGGEEFEELAAEGGVLLVHDGVAFAVEEELGVEHTGEGEDLAIAVNY